MSKSKLNGSVDLLAQALRRALTEAVETGMEPVRKDMGTLLSQQAALEKRQGALEKRQGALEKEQQVDRQNMTAQFAQVHKTLGQLQK